MSSLSFEVWRERAKETKRKCGKKETSRKSVQLSRVFIIQIKKLIRKFFSPSKDSFSLLMEIESNAHK